MSYVSLQAVDAEMILLNLRQQTNEKQHNIVNVTRTKILEGAMRCFGKDTFDEKNPLNVRFVGERGIDTGGPSREFMTMVMRAIQESVIFRGEGTNKELSRDVTGMFTYTPMLSPGSNL